MIQKSIFYRKAIRFQKHFLIGCLMLFAQKGFSQTANLKLSELNIGTDFRASTYKIIQNATQDFGNKIYHQQWGGISTRLQSSFIAEYVLKERQKKLKIGDIIAGEIGLGVLQSDSTGTSIRFNYRFDFGFGFVHAINENHDWGATFLILKFTNDGTIPNGSGSNATLRYRFKKIIVEPSLEVHRQRIIGWLQGLDTKNNLTLQASLIARYQLNNNQQIGIRYEQMPITKIKYEDYNQQSQSRYALRLFYGITF
jgi:hypothetical protein